MGPLEAPRGFAIFDFPENLKIAKPRSGSIGSHARTTVHHQEMHPPALEQRGGTG